MNQLSMSIHKADHTFRRNRITVVGIPLLLIFCVGVVTVFTQQQPATTFDLVLTGGHVMDPESGLDAVRNIGVTGGKIAAISAEPLRGKQTMDVKGLVVAAGFIDLHAHGQDLRSNQMQVRDGVTTALDMEAGAFPVADWYKSREGKAIVNYGLTVGHGSARVKLKNDREVGHNPTSPSGDDAGQLKEWKYERATPEEVTRLIALLDRGLSEGALGIGMGITYTPGARRDEIFKVFQFAAERRVPIFVHVRSTGETEPGSGIEAVQEVIANAATTGAALHIVHISSSGGRQTPICLEMIAGAQRRGLDVTTEAYPYTASSTRIQSALFDPGWQEKMGITFKDLQWSATGERLTEESFEKYRKQGGWVIAHRIPQEICDLAIANPLVMIASDGIPFGTGGEHPRGAGTFARVLGRYVREKKALPLMDALRKMTLMPAQRLDSYVPQMKNKGRIKADADADITIFDADRVTDRATYEKPMQPSDGIVHVLVGGVFVVRNSQLVGSAFPGLPIRRPLAGQR